MGHSLDINNAYNKLHDKIKGALNSNIRSLGCEIRDTLTVNSVAIGT